MKLPIYIFALSLLLSSCSNHCPSSTVVINDFDDKKAVQDYLCSRTFCVKGDGLTTFLKFDKNDMNMSVFSNGAEQTNKSYSYEVGNLCGTDDRGLITEKSDGTTRSINISSRAGGQWTICKCNGYIFWTLNGGTKDVRFWKFIPDSDPYYNK